VLVLQELNRTTDPQHWKDPERFDPDWYAPERAEHGKVGKHFLTPFGGRLRQCLGQSTFFEKRTVACLIME